MSSIKPSVGRKVWYWSSDAACESVDQAMDATVLYVHADGTVNLLITNHWGTNMSRSRVELRDPNPNDVHGTGNAYATWMPYQVGQAKAAS